MKLFLLTAALILGSISSAQAQTRCPALTGGFKPLTESDAGEDFVQGLTLSFILGLDPPSFPSEEIAEQSDACTRGTLEASGASYTLQGDDSNSPPRWASSPDSDRIVFMAIVPPPAVALDWARSNDRSGGLSFSEPPIYVLVVADGTNRFIYGLLQQIPGDTELALAFREALDGRMKPLANYHAETGETEFLIQ